MKEANMASGNGLVDEQVKPFVKRGRDKVVDGAFDLASKLGVNVLTRRKKFAYVGVGAAIALFTRGIIGRMRRAH
jgi:hypothetical protein